MNASVTTLAGLKCGDLLGQAGVSVRAQIEQARSKTARSGSPYLEWVLRDSEESMPLRVWDNHPQFTAAGQARSGDFVEVTALWNATERYGLEPKDWQFRLLQPEEIEALLAGSGESTRRQQADWNDISCLVDGMADPRLRQLSQAFLDQFGDRFRRAAGAREYHHARRGGLVEHVAQMMRCGDAVCRVYTGLNRDLLLTGALFHDCGKLWENCYRERDFTMPYSEPAELLGHITLGIELINKLWRDLLDSPVAAGWQALEPPSDQVRLHLLHLIASHHGEHAFGSPVLPKTPEAMALHYIDNLDAKMEMFRRGYETGQSLAERVTQRVRPLPANLVTPLPWIEPATPPAPGRQDPPPDTAADDSSDDAPSSSDARGLSALD